MHRKIIRAALAATLFLAGLLGAAGPATAAPISTQQVFYSVNSDVYFWKSPTFQTYGQRLLHTFSFNCGDWNNFTVDFYKGTDHSQRFFHGYYECGPQTRQVRVSMPTGAVFVEYTPVTTLDTRVRLQASLQT